MHILCLTIIPLFFIAMIIYFQFWINSDDFKSIFVFFLWGILFGVIYNAISSLLYEPFTDKIATQTIFVRSFLLDGLIFATIFTLCFFLICKLHSIDSQNLWSKTFVVCFGFVCGMLTINNIILFIKSTYITNIFLYIPFILSYISVCICCGFAYFKMAELTQLWGKLLVIAGAIFANALLIGSYNFLLSFRNFSVYLLCIIHLGLIITFYIMDYNQYGD